MQIHGGDENSPASERAKEREREREREKKRAFFE